MISYSNTIVDAYTHDVFHTEPRALDIFSRDTDTPRRRSGDR